MNGARVSERGKVGPVRKREKTMAKKKKAAKKTAKKGKKR